MALTLEKLKRLESVGLKKHYEDNQAAWQAAAKEAYDYIKKGFNGEPVRPDDVRDPLQAIVTVNEDLRKFLNAKKLSQKYWISDFTELVLDQCWAAII
jgi:hypothetical protein